MTPRWEILCLTMPSRHEFLRRLLLNLSPQVAAHAPAVEFVVTEHDPALSLGENREAMRRVATADYISQVDDDDLVADDYVSRILPLLDGVDYVGFRLQAYDQVFAPFDYPIQVFDAKDGLPEMVFKALPGPTYHSLLCGGWWTNGFAWYRDLSPLNPIRRELAIAEPMHYGFGEDSDWASRMRARKIVRTEHFIEQTMYHYLSRPDKTDGVRPGPRTAGECPTCHSLSTVFVVSDRFCNACGATF